uniref:Uncharacterized protein n=1 Tax=Arundo donax TaxID=35708 RepID=A0A0A9FHD5_ARUDO
MSLFSKLFSTLIAQLTSDSEITYFLFFFIF